MIEINLLLLIWHKKIHQNILGIIPEYCLLESTYNNRGSPVHIASKTMNDIICLLLSQFVIWTKLKVEISWRKQLMFVRNELVWNEVCLYDSITANILSPIYQIDDATTDEEEN